MISTIKFPMRKIVPGRFVLEKHLNGEPNQQIPVFDRNQEPRIGPASTIKRIDALKMIVDRNRESRRLRRARGDGMAKRESRRTDSE